MADSPTKDSEGPVNVEIKTGGKAIPDTAMVQSVKVRCEIGLIPEATVVIEAGDVAQQDFAEADGAVFDVGSDITIAGTYGDGAARGLFAGIITGKRMRITGGRGPRLELTCRDKAIILTTARKSGLFEMKKDSDVMSDLLADAGLDEKITAVDSSLRDQLRYDCTDWDFLRALADRNGHVLTIADGTVTSAPPDTSAAAVLTLTLGVDIIEFDAQINTENLIGSAKGTGWDDSSVATVEGSGKSLPSLKWGNHSSSELSGILDDREQNFTTPHLIDPADLTVLADARQLRSAMSAIRGRCLFQGSEKVAPGNTVELKGVGKRFGGTAFVSGVLHKIESGAWTTEVTMGLPDGWLSDSTALGGAAAAGLTAPIHGLQVAIVLKIIDDPDGRARIQIELPMIGETAAKAWARYAQPYATADAGIQFMPEIGDEVLVAFLNADPNAPVVIGSMHNGTNKQANVPDAENTLKSIITKSKLKIEFDDEKKAITIETPGGHSVVMDDDATTVTLEDSTGNKIEMSDSGITITSPGDISMKADGNIDIKATGDATIGGVNVTASAGAAFKGEGGGSAELSGAQTTVKGAIVLIN